MEPRYLSLVATVRQLLTIRTKATERIPLIKGGQMYLQYRIWPLPAQPAYVDFRRVVKRPKMISPHGSLSTGSDCIIKEKFRSLKRFANKLAPGKISQSRAE